jgi:uncharacterized membrane protein
MKTKAILVSVFVLFSLIAVLSVATAYEGDWGDWGDWDDDDWDDDWGGSLTNWFQVTFNGVDLDEFSEGTISGTPGELVPVRVSFIATEDATDARIKVWMSGARSDPAEDTDLFELLEGSVYTKTLSIRLPTDLRDKTDKEYTLWVSLETNRDKYEESYDVRIQKESYKLDVLSFEFDRSVEAGSTLAIDVVLKNKGFNDLEDTFVRATIPELDVSKRVYFGDLSQADEEDKDNGDDDAAVGTIRVKIPSDAEAGVYELELEAYSDDAEMTTVKNIVVLGAEEKSEVLTAIKSKEFAKGEEVTYNLILVNSGNNIEVYEITAESATGVSVRVEEPIVTVPAGSSKTVAITVKGSQTGTADFAVNVHKDGKLVQRVPLVASVTGGLSTGSNTVILTAILAIIFVVLLIVLIILLTRKPARREEFGESYY